jgi:hypothetical protein
VGKLFNLLEGSNSGFIRKSLPLFILLNHQWNRDLILGTSSFAMEYENGTAPVPEPSALILLGCGLIGIGVFRRISKKS